MKIVACHDEPRKDAQVKIVLHKGKNGAARGSNHTATEEEVAQTPGNVESKNAAPVCKMNPSMHILNRICHHKNSDCEKNEERRHKGRNHLKLSYSLVLKYKYLINEFILLCNDLSIFMFQTSLYFLTVQIFSFRSMSLLPFPNWYPFFELKHISNL